MRISQFCEKCIVVIGDIVADQFLHGTISRLSREAPVFILRHDETRTFPGAAANAAANIAALGGRPRLVGLIGDDANAAKLCEAMEKTSVDKDLLILSDAIATTAKVRVIGGQPNAAKKQVIRIDYENKASLDVTLVQRLLVNLHRAAKDAEAIVLSDYNYGVCNKTVFEASKAIAGAKRIPLIVDSRFRLCEFRGSTSATPNQEEAEAILGRRFEYSDAEAIRERFGLESLLVTLGSKGMVLAEAGKDVLAMSAVGSNQPVDVTGAGDTVIAAFALGLAAGFDTADAARVANHAGGIVVMKHGTSVVTIGELEHSLLEFQPEAINAATNEG